MRFIYDPKGDATVMHIERYNALGEPLWKALCQETLYHPRSINLPLGCPICPECDRLAKQAALSKEQP